MKGRPPQAIITDLDPGLRDAIRSELPTTKHVISVWNILAKLSSWFSLPLGLQYAEFKSEFEALYCLEVPDEFDLRWNQMVSRFGLSSDKHIALLFSLRASWALAFIRGYFLARMTTELYAKSVDSFLKGIFNAQTCLRSFFEQVMRKLILLALPLIFDFFFIAYFFLELLQVGISSNFQNHEFEEMQYVHSKTCIPIEENARSTLTPFAFRALQHELVLAMQYAASEMSTGSYIVRHFSKMEGERLVIWIPEEEQIHCSCKEFEFSGILCRHALRILVMKNYFQLPEKYFPSRWRRESTLIPYDDRNTQNGDDEWFQEFHSLTATLFNESSMTKERSDHVHRELTKEITRLLNEVRGMPPSEEVMDSTLSPTS